MKKVNISILSALMIMSLFVGCQSETNQQSSGSTDTSEEITVQPKTPSQMIQGRWQDENNEDNFLIFTADRMITRYGKNQPTNSEYVLQTPCSEKFQEVAGVADISTINCLMVVGNDKSEVFRVLTLDDNKLEYMAIDGSGEQIVMKKIQ